MQRSDNGIELYTQLLQVYFSNLHFSPSSQKRLSKGKSRFENTIAIRTKQRKSQHVNTTLL